MAGVRKMTITKKTLFPVIVVTAATVAALVIYSVLVIKDIKKNVYEQETATTTTYVNESISSTLNIMLSSAVSISQITALQDAVTLDMKDQASEVLTKVEKSLSDIMNTEVRIHVHTKDIKSFIRVWNPEKSGDDLSSFRHTLVEVKKTKKPLAAFEVGKHSVSLRGISPIIQFGTYVGSIEVMVGFDNIIQHAKKDIGVDAVFALNKDMGSITEVIKDTPSIGDYKLVRMGKTNQKLQDEMIKAGTSVDGKRYVTTPNYLVMEYPVKDFQHKQVGVLFLAKDMSVVREKIKSAERMAYIQLFMITGAFVLLLVILYFVIRIVVGSKLKVLIDTTHELAEGDGDLTKRIDIHTGDEFELAAQNMNRFIEKVQDTVQSSIDGMHETVSASEELSATSATLSGNINMQTVRVEESSKLVGEVAMNLDKTEELAVTTTEVLEKGRDSLMELVTSMEAVVDKIVADSDSQLDLAANMQELNQQAKEIQSVLGIISDIADQTNLLALNASIEAARAGEHGRGFAVVADEVRKLAERTQDSLADISKITNAIVGSIGTASKAITGVSESMREASDQSKDLVDLADDTSKKLDETVSVSSEMVKMSTYIATKTKDMINAMEDITNLSLENKHAGENVEQVAGSLAEKSSTVSEQLKKFKV